MQDFIEQNQQAYNTIASHFAQTRIFVWDELWLLADYVKSGDRLLDVGCGAGRVYMIAQKKQADYAGIDQSEAQICMARERFPDGNFVVGSMLLLPFEDASYDTIWCIATLHHLSDEETRVHALKEMSRVLKTSGLLVMTNWNLYTYWAQQKIKSGKYQLLDDKHVVVPWKSQNEDIKAVRHYWRLDKTDIEILAKLAGLIVIEQYYTSGEKKVDKITGQNLVTILQKV